MGASWVGRFDRSWRIVLVKMGIMMDIRSNIRLMMKTGIFRIPRVKCTW